MPRALLTVVAVLTVFVATAVDGSRVHTQSFEQAGFEVASVKPNTSGSVDSRVSMPPGRLMVTNLPLGALIEFAYGLVIDAVERPTEN